MGDLSRFVVEDLTPEDEDEFFRILADVIAHIAVKLRGTAAL
ncbi:MAG: hypothetical protein ACK5O2_12435 [Microthrixaceae bacterium]